MPSLAQSNSTALEGWKLDDNSRSSWDILWTCLSTIFACTWTALHLSVPRASRSDGQNIMRKIVAWIFATLAPEFMAGTASQELWVAWVVTKRCNATFKEVEQKTTTSDGSSPHSGTPRWNLIHGFCIYMHGAVLQTSDRHCFPVQYQHVGLLIREGVLKPHHLRAPEIKDRAKADSLAKAFTLLQSFWVTCNIIARRAYDLPITPIEISVVAYVACVAFTYGTWWHKPRDMTTPITIPLPYNRDSEEMPLGLRHLTDSKPDLWFRFPEYDKQGHVHGVIVECFFIVANIVVTCFKPSRWKSILKNEQMLIAPIDASTSEAPSVVAKKPREDEKSIPKTKSSGLKPPVNHELEEEKGFDDTFIGNIYGATFFIFISVVFCGIHVAA
ncbi:hypothetical protein N7478_001029 [Penicillium angulare]|uniref:uncharacterized protein n=1 Tax=Penicillium angulare TaxID=116970 RepID=UPI002540C530|nr:uncharacterized protein N7478_001029 [Penicillium angulare]KAJ5291778.1 hypothetical protein N7478_001029 [Penicillium angulare]